MNMIMEICKMDTSNYTRIIQCIVIMHFRGIEYLLTLYTLLDIFVNHMIIMQQQCMANKYNMSTHFCP